MSKQKWSRRQLFKFGSSAMVSSLVPPAMISVRNPSGFKGFPAIPVDYQELCFTSAVDLSILIRKKKISSREVMEAHLQQITKVNAKVNAIITRIPEDQLLDQARQADESLAKGKWNGQLHGLPMAVKDLAETKGILTTYGSPMWKDNIPSQDALLVARQKKAGAIIIGKTNVPELGMGSQTFNPIFGPTLNPYDLSKTCGGSTGGGAVALACGMTPIADGSDMGGSLRNPGSFCNVVGLRPSPGRVPVVNSRLAWQGLSVQGPMARTVSDCAFLLSVQAGPDWRSPISINESGQVFNKPLDRNFKGVKVAFIKDLGLPWEKEVLDVIQLQRSVFESIGCKVEENEPDMTDANECFINFRHWQYEVQYGDLLESNADKMNDYTKWHIAEGRKLTGTFLSRLEVRRSNLYRRMQKFLEQYEYLILPVSQVLPFDVRQPYPTEIGGVRMTTYLDWMKSSYYISVIGNPSLSVPCAFSKSGLPIGLQIVGRPQADLGVLQLGFAFEQATQIGKKRPVIAY